MRLAGFDYTQPGGYLVTICLQDRRFLLGNLVDGCVALSGTGQIVERLWNEIPRHYPHVALDGYVVMPNHMHGVLIFGDAVGAGHARPLQGLPIVVGSFKSAVTKELGRSIWQRSYWDRIIRSESELHRAQNYVEDNPLRWAADPENPVLRVRR
jgi:REP element-mobilizing transposase RayT